MHLTGVIFRLLSAMCLYANPASIRDVLVCKPGFYPRCACMKTRLLSATLRYFTWVYPRAHCVHSSSVAVLSGAEDRTGWDFTKHSIPMYIR